MINKIAEIGSYRCGAGQPLLLIAGPCVIESRELTLRIAGSLLEITKQLPVQLVFKASFDKANRSSGSSFRGPGIDEGLKILADVRDQLGVPVLTDVHDVDQVEAAAAVVDMMQTPAFLCRQTDFIHFEPAEIIREDKHAIIRQAFDGSAQ